jgi:hypothetical protein
MIRQHQKHSNIVAKSFENGCGTRGLEKPNTIRGLPTDKLRSILRQRLIASEEEEWLAATHAARKGARMAGQWLDAIATDRKAIFVSWAEPSVSFRKEVRLLYERNTPEVYENTGRPSHFQIL